MRIEASGYLSLHFGEEGFIGILPLSKFGGIEIKLNDFWYWWALVDVGGNNFKIVAFPDEGFFRRWVAAQPGRIDIIQAQGSMGKEEEK